MEAKHPEITLGEPICQKLREIYYPEFAWIDCYKLIAIRFSKLKNIAKNFYCDKNERYILSELTRYSEQDIKDVLDGNE